MLSMYSPEPSDELILIRPAVFQSLCQKARCAAWIVDAALVVSPLITELAVLMALPPVHVGAATITRNEPSVLAWNETWAVRPSGLDAVTLRPPALMPAREPNVWPDAPSPLLSAKVSLRVAVAPD